jgi:hypothetical protein
MKIDIDPKLILLGALLSSLAMICVMLWLINVEIEKTRVIKENPCAYVLPDYKIDSWNYSGGMIRWPMNKT